LIAVSLDIKNAFNTLPWRCIMEGLEYHGVPPEIGPYDLRAVIGTYLRSRKITYLGRDGAPHSKAVCCGVPQESVLGPTLWNVGYNGVLRGYIPPDLDLVCYADDILVLARGRDDEEARAKASAGARLVVNRIRRLWLSVALQKTKEPSGSTGLGAGHRPGAACGSTASTSRWDTP